jgi:hypothetical protein
VGGLNRRVSSDSEIGDSPVEHMNATHARWEIRHLATLARHGSLAAGRELIHRAITQWDLASSQRPDLLEPALYKWLKGVLSNAAENPRLSVGELIAPRDTHPRPISQAELIHALSLSQEAYFRVQTAVDEGAPLSTVFEAVAEELNALGYRNANSAPLTASSVRRRYYEVRRTRRRHRTTP